VPTSTNLPHFLQARRPSCHPTNSVKALKADSHGKGPLKLGLSNERIKELIMIKKLMQLKMLMQVQLSQPPKGNCLYKTSYYVKIGPAVFFAQLTLLLNPHNPVLFKWPKVPVPVAASTSLRNTYTLDPPDSTFQTTSCILIGSAIVAQLMAESFYTLQCVLKCD